MKSRVIVLTGASRGLGKAMATYFAGAGHLVVGCARSTSGLAELSRSLGKNPELTALDVTDDSAVQAWADAVVKKHGAPDLLLNNAAVVNKNAALWEVSPAEFSKVIDINIKGVFNVIRAFVPEMIKRKAGVIVNFSSGWGRHAEAEVGPYCATKFAVEALSKSLAAELPNGMASIPLNPGVIDTDMLQSCFGGSASSYPPPREWVKRAGPFLLSLNESHNGQSLSVS